MFAKHGKPKVIKNVKEEMDGIYKIFATEHLLGISIFCRYTCVYNPKLLA